MSPSVITNSTSNFFFVKALGVLLFYLLCWGLCYGWKLVMEIEREEDVRTF